jgi:hypothetical protein
MDIQDQLLIQAKKVAAETHRSLTAVVEDALRAVLEAPKSKAARPFKMKTFDGGAEGGVRPGIDLDNTAETIAFLESERDARYRR